MDWILLSVLSSVLLGAYDASKKWSVRENAVPIVLMTSVSIGALIYLPLVVLSKAGFVLTESLVVQPMEWERHGLVIAKSLLVGSSWTFAFYALKQLPLTIAAPIRATSPFWTITVAIMFFHERPTPVQWLGILTTLFGFWRFTLVGRREGIRFVGNRSVFLMVIATLLGACSSIYDKWLMQNAGFEATTLQAWFTIYLVPVMLPMAFRWYLAGDQRQQFQWRPSIVLISPLLIAADWFYFVALSDSEAMISVVSVVRRCSVMIALVFGAKALSEKNFKAKAKCVGIILAGVILLTWHG